MRRARLRRRRAPRWGWRRSRGCATAPRSPRGSARTVYDHTVNVYGTDPATGFAARPLDNRGVQYGLAVLNRGEITTGQFLALNREIGGFDADLNHVPERHRADPEAARRALDTGRILSGRGGLTATPVIDYRRYTDDREGGDIHMIVHQFTTRARVERGNGHAGNHVMAVGGRWGFTEEEPDLGVLFRQMDEWLMNVMEGNDTVPWAERVLAAKPAGLVDHCWDTRGAERTKVTEPLAFDGTGTCAELYRAYPTPRQVAGAPLTNDIVSCRLKPPDPADYEVVFTSAEWADLEAIFAEGVCDWTRPDAHGEGYQGTWLSFRAVGGQPGALSVEQAPGPGRDGWEREREVRVDAGEPLVGRPGRQPAGPMGQSGEKHGIDIPAPVRYPVGVPRPPEPEARERRP